MILETIMRMTVSDVPPPMAASLESRKFLSTGYSCMKPYPPNTCTASDAPFSRGRRRRPCSPGLQRVEHLAAVLGGCDPVDGQAARPR